MITMFALRHAAEVKPKVLDAGTLLQTLSDLAHCDGSNSNRVGYEQVGYEQGGV